MDDTAFELCGQQLYDLLTKQVAPPPGSAYVLGFLGQAVAVDPESFLSGAEYNPARVNAWLSLVAEPLASVGTLDHRVEAVPWTAFRIMESIGDYASSLAPVASPEQASFNKAKSDLAQSLGGLTSLNAAPSDWYDPKRLPEWSRCHLASSLATSTGTRNTGIVPPHLQLRRYWAWREVGAVQLEAVVAPQGAATVATGAASSAGGVDERARLLGEILRDHRALAPAASGGVAAKLSGLHLSALAAETTATAAAQPSAAPPLRSAAATSLLVHALADVNAREIAAHPGVAMDASARMRYQVARRLTAADAIRVSAALADTGDRATASSVESSSLTIDLGYRVVQLSRDPWWSDLILQMDGWCIPGLRRGALAPDPQPDSVVGVPVALVLTSDVKVEARWSASDRASASSSTHLGPWALQSARWSEVDANGLSSLTIPGMQAMACIYRALPVLPPKDSPS